MKNFINKLKEQPYWYLWVIGTSLLLLNSIGVVFNIVSSSTTSYILITSTILCCAPKFLEKKNDQ